MNLLKRFSVEGEYFQYRKSAKFLSEILIALGGIVGVGCIATLIVLGVQLDSSEDTITIDGKSSRDITFALLVYTSVILIVCISDVIFAFMLYSGIQQLKLSYCLFWRGATITSLIITGMITLSFITMIHSTKVLLGYLPSVLSKPFSLWVINGFILELAELRSLPYDLSGTTLPPAKPNFSLSKSDSIKRSTTVFKKGKKFGTSYVVSTKVKSIPE